MRRMEVEKPLYPLVSIISSLAMFCVGLTIAKKPYFWVFLAAICFVYVLFGYGKAMLKFLLFIIPVSIVIASLSALFSGVTSGVQTFGRLVLMGISAVTPSTLKPVNLTRSLEQMKCPRIITIGMLVTVRFVPILINESKQIIEAMKTRGVNVAWYNVPIVYRAFLLPFTMKIISISDILSLSIETRGFDITKSEATVYKPVMFGARDLMFCIVLVITSVLAVILI